MTAPVRSLWIGGQLSAMEQLSIRSFLANGHECHLYSYEPLTGVPEGTILHDAREILPESKIFRYTGNGSYAGFSDHFRYEVLRSQGGWWADLDVVCLRPFPEPTHEVVVSMETNPAGEAVPATCVIYSSPGSRLVELLCERTRAKDPATLAWGDIGPSLMAELVRELGLEHACLPWQAFCPIPYTQWFDAFLPGRAPDFGPETYAVHYWHEFWRRSNLDKNENYGPRSLYEILRRRYGVPSPP